MKGNEMSIPKDTTGQDVSQDVWYWAANSDGVAGAGKFIISNGGATFFINGSEYQAESFTTFARCENPEAKVHPHRQQAEDGTA